MADEQIASQILTFKYRLLPSRKQHDALRRILDQQRELYNAALQERIDAYRKVGKSISYFDQCKSLTEIRRDCPGWAALPVNLQRGTLKRLDEAFKGFFNRVKKGDKPGFPRFKGRDGFASFQFAEWDGIQIAGNRIRFKGLPGGLRTHTHRPLPDGTIRSALFKRDCKGWHVCLAIRFAIPVGREGNRVVGIDMGITTLAMLSTGEAVPNPKFARRSEREMRRRQRALARCRRGSRQRLKARAKVATFHRKIANSRSTYLHQVSARLIHDFDVIAIEKLNVKGLSRSVLARDVHDAAWSRLKHNLAYKAAKAGVRLVGVDPKYTSQTCPECGAVAKKTLAERTHRCPCGCLLDRDHAAALVILHRAVAGPGFAKQRSAAV